MVSFYSFNLKMVSEDERYTETLRLCNCNRRIHTHTGLLHPLWPSNIISRAIKENNIYILQQLNNLYWLIILKQEKENMKAINNPKISPEECLKHVMFLMSSRS